MNTPTRHRLLGLLGLLMAAVLIFLVGAIYGQLFKSVVRITVDADRSGLLLDPKADVTMRGVNIGKVRAVDPVDGRAQIEIALEPDQVARVTTTTTAQIVAPTVFGAKYVDLVPPTGDLGREVREGDVLRAPAVSTETNQVFDGLLTLLDSVDVSKLNATLGALSTALQGRGTEIGSYLTDLNRYLIAFNPNLPAIQRDIRDAGTVASIYADASPNLLRILMNAPTAANTLVDKQAGLDALFFSFIRLGNDGQAFSHDVEKPLDRALPTLLPTTGVVSRLSPIFPCLLGAMNNVRVSLQSAIGGDYPGVHTFTSFLPQEKGYQFPVDLAETNVRDAPSCRGGPIGDSKIKYPFQKFDEGVNSVDFSENRPTQVAISPQNLAVWLFGPGVVPFLSLPTGHGPAPTADRDANGVVPAPRGGKR